MFGRGCAQAGDGGFVARRGLLDNRVMVDVVQRLELDWADHLVKGDEAGSRGGLFGR